MNITITQDNSRIETLGSNGASIILKLYDLAMDSNNTLTLRGNINTAFAYGDQVDYLNTTYGPDLIVNATNRYITFEDSAVLNGLLSQNVGDGVGITETDLNGLHFDGDSGITFKGNTDITSFVEFKYCTNITGGHNGPFYNCTNLRWVGLPDDFWANGDGFFEGVCPCNIIVSSLEHYLTHDYGGNHRGRIPLFGEWNTTFSSNGSLYINDKNHKVEDAVISTRVTSEIKNTLSYSHIKSITWESDQNIPRNFAYNCKYLTSLTITGNVTNIGPYAFMDCENLTTVSGIENATVIDQEAFRNSLITGTLNCPNLTYLGKNAFLNTNITSVSNLGSITSADNVFENCKSLTSVNFPTTLRSCSNPVYDATSMSTLYYPEGCTKISEQFRWGDGAIYVELPSTVQIFYGFWDCFRDFGNASGSVLVIKATTPPTSSGYDPSNTSGFGAGFCWGRPGFFLGIYVPDDSVSAYTSASGYWSAPEIQEKIKPISQLETDSPTMWAKYNRASTV